MKEVVSEGGLYSRGIRAAGVFEDTRDFTVCIGDRTSLRDSAPSPPFFENMNHLKLIIAKLEPAYYVTCFAKQNAERRKMKCARPPSR